MMAPWHTGHFVSSAKEKQILFLVTLLRLYDEEALCRRNTNTD